MLRILILEDDMQRIETFGQKLCVNEHNITYVTTAAEAIRWLDEDEFDLVFLDHDLGGKVYVDTNEKNTGSEVVRHMTQPTYVKSPVVIIHSLNTPAAKSMEHALAYEGYEVHRIPFTQLVDKYLDDPFFIS
jgi:CheY-like chemotaxis protein